MENLKSKLELLEDEMSLLTYEEKEELQKDLLANFKKLSVDLQARFLETTLIFEVAEEFTNFLILGKDEEKKLIDEYSSERYNFILTPKEKDFKDEKFIQGYKR